MISFKWAMLGSTSQTHIRVVIKEGISPAENASLCFLRNRCWWPTVDSDRVFGLCNALYDAFRGFKGIHDLVDGKLCF